MNEEKFKIPKFDLKAMSKSRKQPSEVFPPGGATPRSAV